MDIPCRDRVIYDFNVKVCDHDFVGVELPNGDRRLFCAIFGLMRRPVAAASDGSESVYNSKDILFSPRATRNVQPVGFFELWEV